jgi:O-succinylbenzoic acid--CoA ligase
MRLDFSVFTVQQVLFNVRSVVVEPWQQEIADFLQQWCDEQSFVEVKTSGSTGEPKLIRMPKQTMLRSAQMTNSFFGLNETSTALLCLPASYIAGKMMLVRAIVGRYTLIAVQPSSNPFETVVSDISSFNADINFVPVEKKLPQIDFTAITPYQLVHSSNYLPAYPAKNVIIGGSTVTPAMEEMIKDWPMAMYETFGMTETASHIALRTLNGAGKSDYFKVLPGVQISIDERGCLEIFAPHLHEDKLITNDLVELHDHRSFRWLGRFDRVVNSGGIKLFPEQIERKLQDLIQLPFFIASLPHPALGEQLVLVMESDELQEVVQQELIGALKHRLQRYELPGQFICIPEFVYSTGNKVLRNDTLNKRIGH